MKKLFFSFLFCLSGMLSTGAQNTVTITLKDGSTITAPAEIMKSMDYTVTGAGNMAVLNGTFAVSSKPALTRDDVDSEGKIQFLTFHISDILQPYFQDIAEAKLTNVETGRSEPLYGSMIQQDGSIFSWYGTGLGLFGTVESLTGYEPKDHTIEMELTARFAVGDITFTKKASCTFTYKPNTQVVDDAYYLVGTHNNWQTTDALIHLSSDKYDGKAFQLTISAATNGGQRTDHRLRIVPASAINGGSYDPAKAVGVQETFISNEGTYGFTTATGGEATDIVLSATDGADLYEISYYPSFNSLSISTANADRLFDRCYSNLGFANAERNANGSSDIPTNDPGMTSMIRQLVNLNDLPTDNVSCWWKDPGLPDLNYNTWTADNPLIYGIYLRLQKGVETCNKYLLCSGTDEQQRAEVRFLRAYYNAQLLDLFGNVPVSRSVNDLQPQTMARKDFFEYIAAELMDCVEQLPQPRAKTSADIDYGRADKAAAWLLLARLYLNAEVYTGTAQWQQAIAYAQKIVDSNTYGLYTTHQNGWTAYQQLFMGDNGENGASREALFAIPYDGLSATDWSQMFFCAATHDWDMTATDGGNIGISQTWAGYGALPELVGRFFADIQSAPHNSTAMMVQAAGDDRALLWGADRQVNAADADSFTSCYSLSKFINRYATGGTPKSDNFPDYDLFLMRYAEVLLTLAEANLRIGNTTAATNYLNQVRRRANAVSMNGCTLDDVLSEWTREFYFEGRHRTDLVRFGRYGGATGYQWHWKGGQQQGTDFPVWRNVFPIPQQALNDNPNAQQNHGY